MASLEAIDERFFYLQLHFTELMGKCNGNAEQEEARGRLKSTTVLLAKRDPIAVKHTDPLLCPG
jgi:hypothetical protein